MPWYIKDNCVYKEGDSEPIKCHDTADEAKAHLAALYANAGPEAQKWAFDTLLKADESSLMENLGLDPNAEHFFTDCVNSDKVRARVDDPEAFCAFLHQRIQGKWPGEDRGEKAAPAQMEKVEPTSEKVTHPPNSAAIATAATPRSLPRHARRIFRAAYQASYDAKQDDNLAGAAAWVAVKDKYEQRPDGSWRRARVVKAPASSGAQPAQSSRVALPSAAKAASTGQFKLFIPLTKVDEVRREVYGWAAEEEGDKSNEIMDYARSLPYWKAWSDNIQKASGGKSLGNVRAMHNNIAAGKLIAFEPQDAVKKIWVGAKIIDDNEWNKVVEGVYTGFSVGGNYGAKWPDPERPALLRYEAKPTELSLVDNPCMKGATFEFVKADGMTETRAFKGGIDMPDELLKAADPVKLIQGLQELRNKCEVDGDLEGADLYTQAICLTLQASGQAEEPEGDGDQVDGKGEEAASAGGDAQTVQDEEAMLQAAKAKQLKKAGRVFSGDNASAMHQVIQTLAAMLAKSGDKTAVKISALYAPADSEAEAQKQTQAEELKKRFEGLASADDLRKLAGDMGKIAVAVEAINTEVAKIAAQPMNGGPAPMELPLAVGSGIDLNALSERIAKIEDPGVRAQLQYDLTALQIRQAQQTANRVVAR